MAQPIEFWCALKKKKQLVIFKNVLPIKTNHKLLNLNYLNYDIMDIKCLYYP